MEEKFLKQLREASESSDFGSLRNQIEIWYNEDGDCVQFKTIDVASIRKRIDQYLTLYYSAEKRDIPIGFQLKDVKALINKFELESLTVGARYSKENSALTSISIIIELILKAYEKSHDTGTINSRNGYRTAFETLYKNRIAGLAGV